MTMSMLHYEKHEVFEPDLRGRTLWFRFVGHLSLDEMLKPSVTAVGGWRRSMPHAFASFLEALGEVTKIKVAQGFDDDGRSRHAEPTECVCCRRPMQDADRSPNEIDICMRCARGEAPCIKCGEMAVASSRCQSGGYHAFECERPKGESSS